MPARAPLATYRLQFNSNFRFRDAISILGYLQELGVTHVYASPVLASRSGSGHGYDVTDPTKIDLDQGGEEEFAALQSALEQRGMGLVLDLVPNHMAASSENRWWMDVLEFGPDSPFASYFDIDWKPPSRALENKLLLPFLGRPFGDVLNDGELHLDWQGSRFVLLYGEQVFPIAPTSYAQILNSATSGKDALLETDSPSAQEWRGVVAVAHSIATANGTLPAADRRAKFEGMCDRLHQLLIASPDVYAHIERSLEVLNGKPGRPNSFNELEHILAGQHYRLAFWQTASDAINYRRFFSITDLVGVRVDDPAVFDATHEKAIRIGLSKSCSGFRIDHIDGLREPARYLKRLRERLSSQRPEHDDPYLLVEKILEENEWLPEDWPVEGTTGYDYLNFANRLLVDERQAKRLEEIYSKWIGLTVKYEDLLYDKKKFVMRTLLGVEMRALSRVLAELARDDRYARELHPAELAEALIEVTACLPVYRTYIQSIEVPEAAQKVIGNAIELARTRRSTLPAEYFDFVSDVLLLAAAEHIRPEQREARLAFVTRWQQFTGSIMAKGLEDTALYIYFPLASLNEVGGDPRLSLAGPSAFHELIGMRQKNWPNSMNTTTTHDTKRSEDTRARIAVLSEIPEKWEAALRCWSRGNDKFVHKANTAAVPDRNEEYLFYQTLVGVWPLHESEWTTLVPRLQDYMIKATREAKVHTRWTTPNETHESALRDFVAGVLDKKNNAEFCSKFEHFQQFTALYGMLNGLSQTLLKATCPGAPDCYQGAELWDLRLVDPDNRGTIDYEKRRELAGVLRETYESRNGENIERMLASWQDGLVKMHVLNRALNARTANPDLFLDGEYLPLEIRGQHEDRVIAFARKKGNDWVISVSVRCVASLQAPIVGAHDRREFWQQTEMILPNGAPVTWANALAGNAAPISSAADRLYIAAAFEGFPLALLQPT
ncbi:MAG TPA: malto-oligosyltrehalose synthase [Candidatus Udaeobacter sp.]